MSPAPAPCASCGAPRHADQRYCLSCGARVAAPRVDALAELGFDAAPEAAAPSAVRAERPVPRRLTVAMAALALALGGLAGAAVGPAPEGSVAAAPAARVVALVVPAAAPRTVTVPAEEAAAPPVDEGTPETPRASAASDDTKTTTTTETTDTQTPAATETTTTTPTPSTAGTAPAHVWLVALPAADAATAFGPTSPLAPLVAQGLSLTGYTAAGPTPASNQLALLGGQVPTADCAADLAACVLPAGETSLPDQLTSIQLTWRAYVEDPAQRCTGAPAPRVGTSLFTTLTQRGDCATTTVGVEQLTTDLASTDATPALSLVVADTNDRAKALADQVLASEAYKKDGVLVLAPDAPSPTAPTAPTGALVLAPQATAGATDATATGPVALLRSVDGRFGLDPLGAAAQATAGALDPIFPPTNPSNSTRRSP